MNRNFKILMKILNNTLDILNSQGYHLRDDNDKDFYIKEIYYNPDDDELYCEYVEG